jgi:hypothetical protein
VTLLKVQADMVTERHYKRISFCVSAGTPRVEVEATHQYTAMQRVIPFLAATGHELDPAGKVFLWGPYAPTDAPQTGFSSEQYLANPARREKDKWYLLAPFFIRYRPETREYSESEVAAIEQAVERDLDEQDELEMAAQEADAAERVYQW